MQPGPPAWRGLEPALPPLPRRSRQFGAAARREAGLPAQDPPRAPGPIHSPPHPRPPTPAIAPSSMTDRMNSGIFRALSDTGNGHSDYKPRNILVTGAAGGLLRALARARLTFACPVCPALTPPTARNNAGFIGSHVAIRLIKGHPE